MVAMPVLKPLHLEAGLRTLVVSTYQAVSGAGLAGTAELDEQIRKVGDGAPALALSGTAVDLPEPHKFPEPIAYNVIPFAGKLIDDGLDETDEEQKLRNESRKILELPDLAVVGDLRPGAGLHRPLAVDHRPGFTEPISPEQARRVLVEGQGRRAHRHPDAAQGRRGSTRPSSGASGSTRPVANGLSLFVSGDNLRKGAALNAVQIAEAILDRRG